VVLLVAVAGVGTCFWFQEEKKVEPAGKQRVAAFEAARPAQSGVRAARPAPPKDTLARSAFDTMQTPAPNLPADATTASGAPIAASSSRLRITAERLHATPAADLVGEPYKLREEKLRLSGTIRSLGDRVRAGGALPAELEFPTFDGGSLTLTNLEFRPQALPNEGVFFAKVKGETLGGHVLLSYVNNALVGAIHAPGLGVYLDIRNGTPQGGAVSDIFMAQLDPSKMPTCGNCNPARGGTFDPARPPSTAPRPPSGSPVP
jgi:hypothetical protein